jgi:hypothetical protein
MRVRCFPFRSHHNARRIPCALPSVDLCFMAACAVAVYRGCSLSGAVLQEDPAGWRAVALVLGQLREL